MSASATDPPAAGAASSAAGASASAAGASSALGASSAGAAYSAASASAAGDYAAGAAAFPPHPINAATMLALKITPNNFFLIFFPPCICPNPLLGIGS